jgi:hypothetical protein
MKDDVLAFMDRARAVRQKLEKSQGSSLDWFDAAELRGMGWRDMIALWPASV